MSVNTITVYTIVNYHRYTTLSGARTTLAMPMCEPISLVLTLDAQPPTDTSVCLSVIIKGVPRNCT